MGTKKIFSRSILEKILKKSRGKKKVVFTNGCFDLLHLGHVRLLERAKKMGDILVVAINSDLSVKKLKGPLRPLSDAQTRAEILSALSCVDYVTIFPEQTPLETIRQLKPDILVKGSDYSTSEIVGRAEVKKVIRFPLVHGFSTSNLIRKIVRGYARKRNSPAH